MDRTALLLSRVQFAFTVSFHIIYAVGKIFLFRIAAHIRRRRDSYRGLVRQRKRLSGRARKARTA